MPKVKSKAQADEWKYAGALVCAVFGSLIASKTASGQVVQISSGVDHQGVGSSEARLCS